MKRLCFLFFLFPAFLSSQTYHQTVTKGLDGDALLTQLIEDYKPIGTLNYTRSREFLFTDLYNVNDSVYGIYTDHKVYLPPGTDQPIQFLLDNNNPDGINTEHTYPQSKGAGDGNARADLHHLYPARIEVNSSRGSLPYAEINDNDTDFWYLEDQKRTSKPSAATVDQWSEKDILAFEPRESVKGDIARSIMYFYTMYKNEADAAEPGYFDDMISTLCDWHFNDPVDSLEWDKTFRIADFQNDKENPFVLDCSLASRSYCPSISAACQQLVLTNTKEIPSSTTSIRVFPNPNHSSIINIDLANFNSSASSLVILDVKGQVMVQKTIVPITDTYSLEHEFNPGVYVLSLSNSSATQSVLLLITE